jgi:hypothetical protein
MYTRQEIQAESTRILSELATAELKLKSFMESREAVYSERTKEIKAAVRELSERLYAERKQAYHANDGLKVQIQDLKKQAASLAEQLSKIPEVAPVPEVVASKAVTVPVATVSKKKSRKKTSAVA